MAPAHGHQLVADVIHEHPGVGQNAVRKHAHHVADPLHRLLRAQPLADAAEAADVAEQERDLGVPPCQQVGMQGELFRKLAGEELLELHAGGEGRVLLFEAGHPGRHAAGDQLDQHRLQLADQVLLQDAPRPPAVAIDGPHHGPVGIEQGRRHYRFYAAQAGQLIGSQAGQFPERPLFLADLIEDAEAGPPIVFGDLRPRGKGTGLPGAAVPDQDPARIEADDVDDGLGGLLEEVGRTGRALKDAHRGLQPMQHLPVQLAGRRLTGQAGEPPDCGKLQVGRHRDFGQAVQAGRFRFSSWTRTAFFPTLKKTGSGISPHAGRFQGRAVVDGDRERGAEILDPQRAVFLALEQDVPAGDGVLFQRGDHQSGKGALRIPAERPLLALDLPAQFQRAVEDFVMDRPLVFVDANLPGKTHEVSRVRLPIRR